MDVPVFARRLDDGSIEIVAPDDYKETPEKQAFHVGAALARLDLYEKLSETMQWEWDGFGGYDTAGAALDHGHWDDYFKAEDIRALFPEYTG